MAPQRYLITGATGFVGSHLAEACVGRGLMVSTLARPASDTSLLERWGVRVQRGDLTDPAAVAHAVEGVEVVVHCAAKVGDWGPVADYQGVNVEALRLLLEACRGRPLARFVHISTLGVYAARNHYGTDESEPSTQYPIDAYTQTKSAAEQVALRYHQEHQVPVVVLRPGFVYGPRDRTVLPKLIESLRCRSLRYLNGGWQALNTIYVGNLVDAVFLAVQQEQAVGRVYNLTDGELVSKRRFIDAIVRALELPAPGSLWAPVWGVRAVAQLMERFARMCGAKEPPTLTQARVKFLGLNLDFSIERARRELGYQPRVPFEKAMTETMAWYKQQA